MRKVNDTLFMVLAVLATVMVTIVMLLVLSTLSARADTSTYPPSPPPTHKITPPPSNTAMTGGDFNAPVAWFLGALVVGTGAVLIARRRSS